MMWLMQRTSLTMLISVLLSAQAVCAAAACAGAGDTPPATRAAQVRPSATRMRNPT